MKPEGRASPRDSGRGAPRGGHSSYQRFPTRMNPKEQQQQISCLIEYLQEESQLPVSYTVSIVVKKYCTIAVNTKYNYFVFYYI